MNQGIHFMEATKRSSGVLLHPSSLPGPYGMGELGEGAHAFAADLAAMGQCFWQMLPLGPTGFGNSPYASPSSFAGNPLLISLQRLIQTGCLSTRNLQEGSFSDHHVNFEKVVPFRMKAIEEASYQFLGQPENPQRRAFEEFVETQSHWLKDYALFTALKQKFGRRPWFEWPKEFADRSPEHIKSAKKNLNLKAIEVQQFFFHQHWQELKNTCRQQGIQIIGDLPIFVAPDSVDVWVDRHLFHVDETGKPSLVAGVPPDDFSDSGQRWGNPLYRWDVMARDGYAWWKRRFQKMIHDVDMVRIDHFRGFEAFWEIPADEETAVKGRWVKGPGKAFFDEIASHFGPLSLIAEDLGLITPEVHELRLSVGLPGMRVLQFILGEEGPDTIPAHFPGQTVCYSGTHDNDTAVGWLNTLTEEAERNPETKLRLNRIFKAIHSDGTDFHWDLIATALNSGSNIAMVPLQDILGLDSTARMNLPGQIGPYWRWRFTRDALTPAIKQRMKTLTQNAGRLGPSKQG